MDKQIKISEAQDRFDNVSFSNVIENGKSLPLFATYTCPVCDEQIRFTKSNLEQRAKRDFSNLSREHQMLFNKTAQGQQFNNLEFLDWYCQNCKLPVRAYLNNWAGGKHGDAGADIIYVLEIFD